MSARSYLFTLPYQITAIQDSVGIADLQSQGLWDQIPADLQAKLQAASGWFSGGAEVTKADLDELPDAVWAFIANELSLKWTPGAQS